MNLEDILNDPSKAIIIVDKKVLADLKLETPASESADQQPVVIND